LRCFSELAYKPKLVKVILSESILCGFQGCNIFRLMGNCGLQSINAILERLDGSRDDLLELGSF